MVPYLKVEKVTLVHIKLLIQSAVSFFYIPFI
jgi:hypothetical protein